MRTLIGSACVALIGLLLLTPAWAVSVDLVPSSPTVSPGDAVDVDVVVSGLAVGGPPSVGSFDLDVSFDPTVLMPTGVTFGLLLGDPDLFEALVDATVLASAVTIAEVSLLSPTELDELQPSTFTLATLSFSAIDSGTTHLTLTQGLVDDAFGLKLVVIPAAPSLLALVVGVLALLTSRGIRRRTRAPQRDGPTA